MELSIIINVNSTYKDTESALFLYKLKSVNCKINFKVYSIKL